MRDFVEAAVWLGMTDEEIISKAMALLGSRTSEKKTRAVRLNAKKGGWPKGKKRGSKTDAKPLGISQLTENKV